MYTQVGERQILRSLRCAKAVLHFSQQMVLFYYALLFRDGSYLSTAHNIIMKGSGSLEGVCGNNLVCLWKTVDF